MQSTNLPAISDLLKPGQEILVQIAKEPIAKKGARITSHIALPGRFLVFMPTVNHTGVSRKIESDAERRRLKEILLSEKGDATGGFIVRTAAEGASEEELRSDLRFLLNLWADIKNRSESSKSPALIYHDLNLVERILRDQVTDTFSAIWVDTEDAYERVLRFLQRFQPSLIRRVKLYLKDTPLFEQFGITEEINKALRSKVWLKSGGSIVINQTEALVAIDINTGKFVGKTARLEDTIVKTNLDAIPEIVRQIRLRDLGGIIIIDFIDMDERKNRNRVMAALEDELKSDRAPSKVLQFNDFGLVAITRKRVKQSLERTLSTPCTICRAPAWSSRRSPSATTSTSRCARCTSTSTAATSCCASIPKSSSSSSRPAQNGCRRWRRWSARPSSSRATRPSTRSSSTSTKPRFAPGLRWNRRGPTFCALSERLGRLISSFPRLPMPQYAIRTASSSFLKLLPRRGDPKCTMARLTEQ